jgi:hypothetical protein
LDRAIIKSNVARAGFLPTILQSILTMTDTVSHSHVGNVRNTYSTYLVALTCAFLPLTITLVILCSLYTWTQALFRRAGPKGERTGRKILITGSSPAAISLARALREAGNEILVADYTRSRLPPAARFSNAFSSFHNLYKLRKWQRARKTVVMNTLGIRIELSLPNLYSGKPHPKSAFTQDITTLIQREKPDLWIPCASCRPEITSTEIVRAVESVQQRALCNILQADEDTTEMLTDESAFTEYVEQLETGIRVPDSRTVISRDEVHRVLVACPESIWELEDLSQSAASSETAHDDDPSQPDGSDKRRWTWPIPPKPQTKILDETDSMEMKNLGMISSGRVTLPLHSKDATYNYIASMMITPDHPWTMREIVTGQHITAHFLVVRNQLRSVVASLPQEHLVLGMEDAELVPSTSLLHKPISLFAEAFAASLPEQTSSFFSLRFVVAGTATTMGTINTLFPTSCFVGVHPSAPTLSLSSPDHGQSFVRAVADAANSRLSYTREKKKRAETSVVLIPAITKVHTSAGARGVYSFYPSLLSLVILPFLNILTRTGSIKESHESILIFVERLLMWQEELFTIKDPWPWWWEWHVRLPVMHIVGRFFSEYVV